MFDLKTVWLVRHHDDEGVDEINVMVAGKPFLRLAMVPRYKTSGLSGDEWRVSAIWSTVSDFGAEPLDGPYHSIETAVKAIYCGVYKSHPTWHSPVCTSMRFNRKGRPLIEMTNDGQPLPLLVALGHLPWAATVWHEQLPLGMSGCNTDDLCFQVGCAEPAVSTCALKKRYSREGYERDAVFGEGRRHALRFCARHLRRGDCGLEDADRNYDVLDGPGPDGHAMKAADESPSSFGGVVTMDAGELP